jgi:hypothetical protein
MLNEIFSFPLSFIQPSQLYINRNKLEVVQEYFKSKEWPAVVPPIPVKLLHGKVVFTDGHTRSFAAHLAGFLYIPVYWDEDELDWEAYQICVDWCLEVGIYSIADLAGRIIEPADYAMLWLDRCKLMQDKLEETRNQI